MTPILFAIDPGTEQSGWCQYDGRVPISSGVMSNPELLKALPEQWYAGRHLAIEMIASYDMPVGREIFHTCVWIGRFQQAWHDPEAVMLIPRGEVKLHLCGSMRAKDPNVRQALLDRLGAPGTKKDPGPTYGVKSHAWSALAVAVTAADRLRA